MNTTVGPSFKVVFVEKNTCKSCEKCTRPTKNAESFQHYPSMHLGSVWVPLITKNWKHYSKIIFKCVNNTVRPILMKVLLKKGVYGSCKQYTRPTKNTRCATIDAGCAIQMDT